MVSYFLLEVVLLVGATRNNQQLHCQVQRLKIKMHNVKRFGNENYF